METCFPSCRSHVFAQFNKSLERYYFLEIPIIHMWRQHLLGQKIQIKGILKNEFAVCSSIYISNFAENFVEMLGAVFLLICDWHMDRHTEPIYRKLKLSTVDNSNEMLPRMNAFPGEYTATATDILTIADFHIGLIMTFQHFDFLYTEMLKTW